uniref:Mitogen-activated protein kinase n=1 Tax=Stomoxys calcitrans TaxID=35570 RepID=A0A1I8P293_STOCA
MTTKSKQDKNKMSEIDENISKLFDIKKRLGKGAYGIVWKALDKRNNETVAVKKIFDAFRDETDAQRTFREIVFLKAFRHHPNIVRLHNVYKASNNLDIYLTFEYMESDLHNIIKKGAILKDIHKRYVMYQLINAIKYIHSGNVIHRDLKPSNVLIDSKCRCKLADFGLARSVSNWPTRCDSHDMSNGGGDAPLEPLLTDYVATRWYRAPEILVASKRYTKGIDMWSLGCILGEMIRGKPLFQGSSTVNQIEKIVSTLPDITEDDIKSVGAGFGSVLLKKQIAKEKKIAFSDLLNEASKDALDLVKALLVLDPLGRLTAKQALNHPYVQKFRNSIPELELNVDILPPFRDDVRLSVPEYRSKLYEIVQISSSEKKQSDLITKIGESKPQRESKSQINGSDKADGKKLTKLKQSSKKGNSEDKYKTHQLLGNADRGLQSQNEALNSHTISKTVTKSATSTTPLAKRKQNKILSSTIAIVDTKYESSKVLEDRHIPRTKSQSQQYQLKANGSNDTEDYTLSNGKRHSTSNSNTIGHNSGTSLRSLTNSHRLYKSSTALNKLDNEVYSKTPDHKSYNAISAATSPSLRQTKSETYYCNKSPCSEKSQAQEERFCYELRIKRLKDKMEHYKMETKNVCCGTVNYAKHKDKSKTSEELSDNNNKYDREIEKQHPFKFMPPSTMKYPNAQMKNNYIELLSKTNRSQQQQHDDTNKLEMSSISGNWDKTDYNLIQMMETSKSFSRRSKEAKKYISNNNYNNNQRLYQHEQKPHKEQNVPLQKHSSRPISKFI